MKQSSQVGLSQAFFVTLYCSLVGLLLYNGEKIFGNMNMFIGPIVMLMLLSLSVLVCGLLVFYKPYKLFFAGKKQDAAEVVLATAKYLFAFLAVLFVVMLLSK